MMISDAGDVGAADGQLAVGDMAGLRDMLHGAAAQVQPPSSETTNMLAAQMPLPAETEKHLAARMLCPHWPVGDV